MTYAEKLRAEYLQAIADCMAAAGLPADVSTLDSRARARADAVEAGVRKGEEACRD